jgi:ATP-dependent DNA helicase DinG
MFIPSTSDRMRPSMRTSKEILSDPVHGLVKEARPAQLAMAASIEEVLRSGGAYFVEAPVATGKTFAYLLTALLAQGRRIVVATEKKALQDQILEKDFPALVRVLGRDIPPTRALPLKGKGQYTCRLAAMRILEKNPEELGPYQEFLRYSIYGDRAEYRGPLPRWFGAATAEDCVYKRCSRYDECSYAQLKREIGTARLVVVNHHVLGAEMFFGLGKLVGGPFDTLIVDEAHSLANGIRSAFTHRVAEDAISSLNDLLRRASETFSSVRRLVEPWELMFEAVPNRHWKEASERPLPVFPEALAKDVLVNLHEIDAELTKLEERYTVDEEPEEPEEPDDPYGLPPAIEVDEQARQMANEESKDFALAIINQAQRRVMSLIQGLSTAQGIVEPEVGADIEEHEMRKARILANTVVFATQDERGRFGINCAPVSVGGIASKYLSAVKTVVLCSATLAVDGQFDHVTSMTGVAPAKTEVLPTSFDYDRQGFAFIPRGMPVVGRSHPDNAEILQRRVEMAVRLVELSDGGAFVLTTANDELDEFAKALKTRFPGRTFAQGHRNNAWDGDPNSALTKFKATPDSILIGSKSFWTGVDVPGGALRLVIVAKLPFPQYGDPIIRARERIAGDNAFRDVQMVDMLTDLRQGIGRLIRSRDDRGCAAILDSRVWEKSYGGLVRRALPWSNNMVTSDFSICEKWLPRFAAHFRKTTAPTASMSTFAQ